MRMTIPKVAWLCFIILLMVPFSMLYADECDDGYEAAETENGRRAIENAEKAHNAAELA